MQDDLIRVEKRSLVIINWTQLSLPGSSVVWGKCEMSCQLQAHSKMKGLVGYLLPLINWTLLLLNEGEDFGGLTNPSCICVFVWPTHNNLTLLITILRNWKKTLAKRVDCFYLQEYWVFIQISVFTKPKFILWEDIVEIKETSQGLGSTGYWTPKVR